MQSPATTIPHLIAAGFHALCDPLIISVLELLRQQELCVCDLCKALGVNQSKLYFSPENPQGNCFSSLPSGRTMDLLKVEFAPI